MEKSCEHFEQMLVNYADGQLSHSDSNKVAEHLAQCEKCRNVLDVLQKSLELAGIIWADGLVETENIHIPSRPKGSELTFAEIERKISESGSAARLLAAAELLSGNPEAETIVKQQYQHIVDTYPETAAAAKAKLRIK